MKMFREAMFAIFLTVGVFVMVPIAAADLWKAYSRWKTPAAKPAIAEHCHGKVVYLQFETAVVTKLRPDGKVWTCGGA